MIARLSFLLWLWLSAAVAQAATYTVVADRDAHLRSNLGTSNFGTGATLEMLVGGNQRQSIVGFTLPAIPANEIVTSATIRFWVNSENDDVISLHRVTDSWAEGTVTWNNTAADFFGTAESSQAVNNSGVSVTFTVTSLVTAWIRGLNANHGVMLVGDAGANTVFASREDGTASRRPVLTIVTAPALTVVKSTQAYFDPYNGTTNPKLIPGGFAAYTVTVANTGTYTVTNNSIVITDPTPAGMRLFVGDVPGGAGPVLFLAGASGLAYTYTSLGSTTDDVDFSNNNGSTWSYAPAPNADQVDPAVTHIRIRPRGTMAASSSFSVLFGYQVQ